MSTENEDDPINVRATALVKEIIGLIEVEGAKGTDPSMATLGLLIGRTAKLEALLERVSEVLRIQSRTVINLSVQVATQGESIDGLLNEELRHRKVQH